MAKLIEKPMIKMKKKLLFICHYLVTNYVDPIIKLDYHNVSNVLV